MNPKYSAMLDRIDPGWQDQHYLLVIGALLDKIKEYEKSDPETMRQQEGL